VIVNVSRGIIYAGDPRRAALDLRQQINAARAKGPAARPTLQSQLTLALADIGAVKFGEFTLASGKRSPI